MTNHKRTAGEIIFLRKFKNSMAAHPYLIQQVCLRFEVTRLEDLSGEQLVELKVWTEMFWPVLCAYSLEIDRLRGRQFLTMKPQPMSC